MTRRLVTALVLSCLAVGVPPPGVARVAAQATPTSHARRFDEIRSALLRLPYYGAFDFLMVLSGSKPTLQANDKLFHDNNLQPSVG